MKIVYLAFLYLLGICCFIPLIAVILTFLLVVLSPFLILAIPVYILQLLIVGLCGIFHWKNPYED